MSLTNISVSGVPSPFLHGSWDVWEDHRNCDLYTTTLFVFVRDRGTVSIVFVVSLLLVSDTSFHRLWGVPLTGWLTSSTTTVEVKCLLLWLFVSTTWGRTTGHDHPGLCLTPWTKGTQGNSYPEGGGRVRFPPFETGSSSLYHQNSCWNGRSLSFESCSTKYVFFLSSWLTENSLENFPGPHKQKSIPTYVHESTI